MSDNELVSFGFDPYPIAVAEVENRRPRHRTRRTNWDLREFGIWTFVGACAGAGLTLIARSFQN